MLEFEWVSSVKSSVVLRCKIFIVIAVVIIKINAQKTMSKSLASIFNLKLLIIHLNIILFKIKN